MAPAAIFHVNSTRCLATERDRRLANGRVPKVLQFPVELARQSQNPAERADERRHLARNSQLSRRKHFLTSSQTTKKNCLRYLNQGIAKNIAVPIAD